MKKQICAFTAMVLLGVTVSTGFAFLNPEEIEILKGVDGVRVEIKRLKPEIERDGLFRSTLQTDAELKLQMAGLKVISEDDAADKPNIPCLYLNLDALKSSLGYVYRIQLTLREMVTLTRKPVKALGTTYRTTERFGISTNLSEIREDAREVVDDFIKAWMEANSK
jgi:hypothetical protein